MNTNFFDDEEELELRPRRRQPRRSEDFDDGSRQSRGYDSPQRPVRRTRSDISSQSSQGSRSRRNDSAGRQPVRRKSVNEIHEMDDFEGFSLKADYIGYGALALVVIAVIVCGIVFLKIQPLAVILIQIVVIAMAVLLRRTPVFVTLIVALLILVAGMVTGKTDFVLCSLAPYLSGVLALKD